MNCKLYFCVAGFLLASSMHVTSIAQTLDDLTFGTESALEIATWNIEWFPKAGETTINAVSDVIEAIEMDVWAIQEIDDTTAFTSMVNELEGYEYILMDGWFGGLVYVYNAATIEIIDAYEIFTESPFWSPLPRSPLVLHFEHNGLDYHAINNHYKCCGNGTIEWEDDGDEEMRRLEASTLIESYVAENLADERVIVLGDLNDLIDEPASSNVFQPFTDAPESYLFTDMDIAMGSSNGWSFPGWPSHLDHILISNELFDAWEGEGSLVETIDIAMHLPGGWWEYDQTMSDHRPVALRLSSPSTTVLQLGEKTPSQLMQITDCLGRVVSESPGQILLYHYRDGTVIKRWLIAN